jgi:hypothetical protein
MIDGAPHDSTLRPARSARRRETVQNLGVLWTSLVAADREGEMKWRVIVELAGADGSAQVHEVSVDRYTTTTCSPDTLGLTLAAGKETLAGLQRHLVQA